MTVALQPRFLIQSVVPYIQSSFLGWAHVARGESCAGGTRLRACEGDVLLRTLLDGNGGFTVVGFLWIVWGVVVYVG